jgi:hypothetical protein
MVFRGTQEIVARLKVRNSIDIEARAILRKKLFVLSGYLVLDEFGKAAGSKMLRPSVLYRRKARGNPLTFNTP